MAFLIPVALFYLTIYKKIAKKRLFYTILYWLAPIGFALSFLAIRYFANKYTSGIYVQKATAWLLVLYLAYLLPFLFFAIFYWVDCVLKILLKKRKFYFKYILGVPLAVLSLGLIIQGVTNRYNLEVRYLEVETDNLPAEFDGLKIAVMGDTHLGNLTGYGNYLRQIRDTINSQNVDLLLFTGDLVNTMPKEIYNFSNYFRQINVNYGRYAVMGNHDFCRYYRWSSDVVREAQVVDTKKAYRYLGFGLLDNDFVILEKDSLTKICIIGVDEQGEISEVLSRTPENTFNILLLHNPKDWEAQAADKENVALTLSGHTHAWQCGFKWRGKVYSPAGWLFKYYDGLYKKNGKNLFITRGVGYVGAPLRIGLQPDIAIITLKNKN
ncbi:MAG: metallophosphoesterase [Prevotellaceae bacterium]|nr:metallophosphoesterase [Prevotellaceae bacterium]